MYYVGNLFYNFHKFYKEINAATLTGAIDVIVVKQEDGTYMCSPFHVRFGKLGVLRSKEKMVDIEINDELVKLPMKLGDSGEAFFLVEDLESDDESAKSKSEESPAVPRKGVESIEKKRWRKKHLRKSLSSVALPMATTTTTSFESPRIVMETAGESVTALSVVTATEVVSDEERCSDFHPFSDGELPPTSLGQLSPLAAAPNSDTELEPRRASGSELPTADALTWTWGAVPESQEPNPEKRSVLGSMLQYMRSNSDRGREESGIYLDSVASMEPDVLRFYLQQSSPEGAVQPPSRPDGDESSDFGISLSQSPVHMGVFPDTDPDTVRLSLCGRLAEYEGKLPESLFLEHLVDWDRFAGDPRALLGHPDLVVNVGAGFYAWEVAGPLLLSWAAFQRPLPDECVDNLVEKFTSPPRRRPGKAGWSIFPWRRTTYAPVPPPPPGGVATAPVVAPTPDPDWIPTEADEWRGTNSSDTSTSSDENQKPILRRKKKLRQKKYKKSLTLSSEILAKLKLNPGCNDVTFSVTTKYQGTSRCCCNLFLWNYDDKVVVSDIDGTITKSDALGQLLPMVGKDWTQSGVAKLFSTIRRNGYHFLYLSARAIGQSHLTRYYLRSICQGELHLPEGPLLLSPSSLMSAFHKEVIERKPEEFKMKCLRDIQLLFPSNPFCAGYGNKVNDVYAYRAVGIPISRIFTVNPKGEMSLALPSSFQTSYGRLWDVVDQMFPPLSGRLQTMLHSAEEYSNFTYWCNPVLNLDVTELLNV